MMKYQVTEQANGLCSIYTDKGESSMADEDLIAFDLSADEVTEKLADLGS